MGSLANNAEVDNDNGQSLTLQGPSQHCFSPVYEIATKPIQNG